MKATLFQQGIFRRDAPLGRLLRPQYSFHPLRVQFTTGMDDSESPDLSGAKNPGDYQTTERPWEQLSRCRVNSNSKVRIRLTTVDTRGSIPSKYAVLEGCRENIPLVGASYD